MYPDRPIRPMPKRRLRDRMSPEQAEHIAYPPHPPSSGPLFNFPYSSAERGTRTLRMGESEHHACHCGHNHSEVESEEEEDERGAPMPSSPSYHYSRTAPGKLAGAHAYAKPGSTASSVDGYESFENTNNKKKRKIPNMGGANSHDTNLSAEMASMGISHAHDVAALDDGDGPGRYYGSAPSTPQHNAMNHHHSNNINSSGTGISGAGRGRFGRSGSGRSERRVLGNSTSLANTRASSKRPPDQAGIISTAIANAQATPPHPGNENVSLLQQEASKNTANKTQFTFTCGSDWANKMAWPGQENAMPGAYPQGTAPPPTQTRARPPVRQENQTQANHSTQTSPRANGNTQAGSTNAGPQRAPPPNQQAPPPPKPRRSATKMYAYAARKRRLAQEYANSQNPPNPAWICEFCEYEDIFGRPPEALIRLYEKKDLADRRRLAEKRRLLAKARMKGRKGKKQGKKQSNVTNTHQGQNPPSGGYDRHPDDEGLDGQDDYYDDDYDNAPPHIPPTRCCDHPGCHAHHPQRSPATPVDNRGGTANGA